MREITVYADVLFLINFSMDLIALYFCGRVLHKPVRKLRLCLSAVIGGLIGTAETVLIDPSSFVGNAALVLSGVLLSALMMFVAYGFISVRYLVRDSTVLWGAGTLLGGVMTYILSLGEPVFIKTNRTASFSAAFGLCFLISYVITRIFSVSHNKRQVHVSLEAAGVTVSFTALCDSGNIAVEPISGLPVVIVSRNTCGELGRMLDEHDTRLKIRAVPIKSLDGERVYMGFIPDRLTVGGTEKNAVVAIDGENHSFGGCAGLVPSSLANENIIKRRKNKNGGKIIDSADD